MAATDLPKIADVQMKNENPTSLVEDMVTIRWVDGCRVEVLTTSNDDVAIRIRWRDGSAGDQMTIKHEISPARVATCILDAYFAEVADPAESIHLNPALQDAYPLIYEVLTE